MNHSQILTKAAAALKKYGFAVGIRQDETGAMCALGVLDFVVNKDAMRCQIDEHAIVARLAKELRLSIGIDHADQLATWSNAQPDGVVAKTFRRLARKWSARGR